MALTDAGRELARRAPEVLAAWDDAPRTTKATGRRGARVLRVGFVASAADEATREIVAEFARRRPGWRAELGQAAWSNPSTGLADGDVDAALLRLPFPGRAALRVEVLFSEARRVALPSGHPLAGRAEIAFRELWDEPFVAAPEETGAWRDHWLATG
ncbi:hypothetical protein M878_42150 [Streptomyces roseochromogenus subsp. oscitans DS 12.976]|uniref:LysR substrate-binding domain-containing protein n=1 Tax=Streptomyces roseochromogenus subsp. oscitans DS 12.976 TaxID=1352936 RepID=V6JRF4_STRRC|nr:hypothetical protein M878_42150 [Streptomyces roseochromogenus subsp. oscitans DS 12.976]